MAYKLVLLDVDGTLVEANGLVPGETGRVLQLARQEGIKVSLATGRTFQGVEPLVAELDLTHPLILANGGLVVSPRGEPLYYQPLPTPELWTLLHYCQRQKMLTAAISGDDTCQVLVPWEAGEARRGLDDLVKFGFRQQIRVQSWQEFSGHQVIKVMASTETPERMQTVLETWPDPISHLSYALSLPLWVEVTAPGVDKSTGAQKLAGHLDIAPEEVLAVGDGDTDLPMLQWAGAGVLLLEEGVQVFGAAPLQPPENGPRALPWILKALLGLPGD